MHSATLDLLQCPCGQRSLTLDSEDKDGDSVQTGTLTCRVCGEKYQIEEGIARMLPASMRGDTAEAKHKATEMAARDEQAGLYDKMVHLNLFAKVEVPMTLKRLGLAKDHILLEAGCGTGRMTREFASHARRVVAVDFSFASLLSNAAKLAAAGIRNVDLVQADVCALPFADESFDRTVSCQVLEHVPSDAARTQAVGQFARTTRKGGTVVVSAYQHSLLTRLLGQKEGEHTGGIYYFRFARNEFRALLEKSLTVRSVTGALVYIHLAQCEKPH